MDQKHPMPNLWALKISRQDCTLFTELSSQDTQAPPLIFRLFWLPKKLIPAECKWSHQKKYLLNFPTQNNLGIKKFKPKQSFNHPCQLKSRVHLTPPPLPLLGPSITLTILLWSSFQTKSTWWLSFKIQLPSRQQYISLISIVNTEPFVCFGGRAFWFSYLDDFWTWKVKWFWLCVVICAFNESKIKNPKMMLE